MSLHDNILPIIRSLCLLAETKGLRIDSHALQAYSYSMESIFENLGQMGFPTRILPINLESILPQTLPCMLVLNPSKENSPNRACLLKAIKTNQENIAEYHVVFSDNSPEISICTFEELKTLYAGHAVFSILEFTSQENNEAKNLALLSPKKDKHWFWNTFFHFVPIYRDVILASTFINCLVLASPLFVMNVYDRVIPNNAEATLWVLALGVSIAYLVDFILKILRANFVDLAGRNTDVVLSSQIMGKLLNLKINAMPNSTGSIVNTVREFEQLREFIGSPILLALIDLPFILLFICLMAWLGGPLAILPIIAVPLMLLISALLQVPIKQSAKEQFYHNAQKNSLLVEVISNIETVKANLLQSVMHKKYEEASDLNAKANFNNRKLQSIASFTTGFTSSLINTALIVWGAYLIFNGQLSMGALIACVILLGRISGSLMQIVNLITAWQKTKASMSTLNAIMDLPEENTQSALLTAHPHLSSSIIFENVSFTYPDEDIPALTDISFQLKQGEKLGIMGITGSGKSTLIKLLLGLYEPSSGKISLGNRDIKHIHTTVLRSRLGYLSQEPVLFSGTVLNNITLGALVSSDYLVMKAATLSGVDDFVRHFPKGYNTEVGEKGAKLSGGQKQSIALARTLLKNPDVLLLDEPTSALDMTSERNFILRAKQALRDKTMIICTHRPSLLDLADTLIVLEKGKIIAYDSKEKVLQQITLPQKEKTE